MALVILGRTLCASCGKVLLDGDDIWGLPIFPPEFGDEARRLSDSAVHNGCHLSDTEIQELLERFTDWAATPE